MAAITIYIDFVAKKMKSDTFSTSPPSICHEVIGPVAMILGYFFFFFNVES